MQSAFKTLIVNIQWAKYYRGDIEKDPIKRGIGGNLLTLGEAENFRVRADGKVYGYIPRTESKQTLVNFEKAFGDEFKNKKTISEVRVVFVASHKYCDNPNVNFKGYTIVGWYNHATVFKEAIFDEPLYYHIVADPKNVYLLDEEDRPLGKKYGFQPIPHKCSGQHWGIGRYGKIYYHNYQYIGHPDGDREQIRDIPKLINQYIDAKQKYLQPISGANTHTADVGETSPTSVSSGGGIEYSKEENEFVEKQAVAITSTYFKKNKNIKLESKEKENCGYDLFGKKGKTEIHVEVKGHAKDTICPTNLTANEYYTMREQSKNENIEFYLSIVTNCPKNKGEKKSPIHNLYQVLYDTRLAQPFGYKINRETGRRTKERISFEQGEAEIKQRRTYASVKEC